MVDPENAILNELISVSLDNADDWQAALDGFRSYGAEGETLAEKYRVDDKKLTMTTVGFNYEPGKWFAMGEWGLMDFRSSFGKREAWYFSGGYRMGKFTPYMIFSKASAKSNTYDSGLDPFAYDAGVIPLNAALNEVLLQAYEQETLSVGLRWDVAKNAALKLQYDYTDVADGSYGRLQNRQPELEKGGHYSVFSVVLDFLF